jgi:hypothetical protein
MAAILIPPERRGEAVGLYGWAITVPRVLLALMWARDV